MDTPTPAAEKKAEEPKEVLTPVNEKPTALQPVIERLVGGYVHSLTQPKKSVTPIHVDEIASRVAKFYELVRKVVDWKEDNALRRSAIERILKRHLFTKLSGLTLTTGISSSTLAQTMILDLIRGGHLPNGEIPQEKIQVVTAILDKYILFLEANTFHNDPIAIKRKVNFYTFIVELASCEVEEAVTSQELERGVLFAMTNAMVERIRVKPSDSMSPEDIYIQTFIGTCRSLYDLDDMYITYQLLQFQYSDWQKPDEAFLSKMKTEIVGVWERMDLVLHHPLAKQFFVLCERMDTVFALVGDVMLEFKDKPTELPGVIAKKNTFLTKIGEYYDKRFATLKKRLFRLAVFSTLSVFASNWVTFYLFEVPLASVFGEGFSLFTAFIDFLVPTAVMFFLVAIIRPPPKGNREAVLLAVAQFVYAGHSVNFSEIIVRGPRRPIMGTAIATVFTATTVLLFYAVGWVFMVAGLPISSVIFDTFTIALTVFAAVTIRNKAKELTVGDKISVTEFALDMISVPMARIGSLLAKKWKEYNIVAFFFTFLIEAPFAKVIDVVEQWSQFIKERRAELH